MFDLNAFVADCQNAVVKDSSHMGIKGIVEKAVSSPSALIKVIGEPDKPGATPFFALRLSLS